MFPAVARGGYGRPAASWEDKDHIALRVHNLLLHNLCPESVGSGVVDVLGARRRPHRDTNFVSITAEIWFEEELYA